jgi:protein-L-isoaspartate(D-aspartate) O-methyltransferase
MLNELNSTLQGIGMTSQRTRDRLVQRLRDQGITEPRVLEAIRYTPRHLFVDEALGHRAYEDTALPIGHGQTISKPLVVARMTELLVEGRQPSRVLEVGTGSGYQAAILCQLVAQVFSVERIAALQVVARQRLRRLGLSNARIRHSDGSVGWEREAPFDGILVTAAPQTVPEGLLSQLALGGVLVIPLGDSGRQSLCRITRHAEGFEREDIGQVSFVPWQLGAI